eukprot:TRINITY_DN4974_c0_g2_i1.p1 TRINITY_DN4974_c0_g2~~TRINITY_DN4974_c0_g2_i1.p1  ORF type:complete len:550 (+),score=227.78 TRINITY_DN4974_c0_g2_i1:76-1725(+)
MDGHCPAAMAAAAAAACAAGGFCVGLRVGAGKGRGGGVRKRAALVADGQNFFDALAARVKEADSLLCVGLDPHRNELPGGEATPAAVEEFCLRLIRATSDVAACYKPNAAFFECLGAEGPAVLERVIAAVPDGIPVLLDAKRGDIGTTAAAYADAAYEHTKADGITLSPYMGDDSVSPFVTGKYASKGAFVLCKTSNPGSNQLQTCALTSGGRVFEEVARLAQRWGGDGTPSVGLVVGATDPAALSAARAAAAQLWILAPGVGAQGGSLEESCMAGLRPDGCGLLLPVSRGISKAADPGAEARSLRDRINEVRRVKTAAAGMAPAGSALQQHQTDFIKFALAQKVLKFSAEGFKLKSGRLSPYFFNAGLFDTGAALAKLGRAYAAAIVSNSAADVDVIFGPAYKGISLGAVVASSLSDVYGRSVGFAYNRKEKKDHGEGGVLVGADMKGKRVLIVDDVITAGTAIRESTALLTEIGATPVGVVIALDRQEKRSEKDALSAVQAVARDLKIPVHSVVTLGDLMEYLRASSDAQEQALIPVITDYRKKYGV